MKKKIIIGGNALCNVVIAILVLSGLSFGSGYSLGASGSAQEEVVVVGQEAGAILDEVAWLMKVVPSPLTVASSPEFATAAPTEPPPPASSVLVLYKVQAAPLPQAEVPGSTISDVDLLTVCQNLPCEVHSEDWEWRGFSTRSKLITEKVSLAESTRSQCEGVLRKAAKTSRAAGKKLECFRMRHREAQCAQLYWNVREALPKDAKGKTIIRSAVALNLLVDFHLNGIRNPNQISLCLGDIRQQYAQFVVVEAQAYQAAYDNAPVRQTELDATFCAEQSANVTKLPLLGKFARGQSLAEFQFPPFPARAMAQDVMNSVCPSKDEQVITSASVK